MRRFALHGHSARAALLVGALLTCAIGMALAWQGQDQSHAAQASLFALPLGLEVTSVRGSGYVLEELLRSSL